MLGLLIWLPVVPYEVVGVLWGPLPDAEGVVETLMVLPAAFLAAPVGAAMGWGLTKATLPTVACATAALALNFVLGSAIAFDGGRGINLGLFLWLLRTSGAGAEQAHVPGQRNGNPAPGALRSRDQNR